MANADTPEDALIARKNGASGIGLCRTEHMVIISYITVLLIIITYKRNKFPRYRVSYQWEYVSPFEYGWFIMISR